MTEIRWGLIDRVRKQIVAGTYVTQKKLCITSARIVEKLRESEQPRAEGGSGARCERPSTSPRRPRTT